MAHRRLVIAPVFIVFFVAALTYFGGSSVLMWSAQGACFLIGAIIGWMRPAGDDRPPLSNSATAGAAASVAGAGLLLRLLFPETGFIVVAGFFSLTFMAGMLAAAVKAVSSGAVNNRA